MKLRNNYYILRHGESLANIKNIMSCWPEKKRYPLTLKGRKEIRVVVNQLKNKNIDLIFASDVLRTKQTAEIVGKALKVKPKYDKRLREYDVGVFNNMTITGFRHFFPTGKHRFKSKPQKGESYNEVIKRILDFLKEIDKKYSDKNILIISHQLPLVLLELKIKTSSSRELIKKYYIQKKTRIKTGELRELDRII